MEHHISLCTPCNVYFFCCLPTISEATSKRLSVQDVIGWANQWIYPHKNPWQSEMKSTFSSLFYLSLRKCSARCCFPLWYRKKSTANQKRSVCETVQSNVSYHHLPSSVCQTNAQNADGPLDWTDIGWGSKQCQKMWCGSRSQSDAVIWLLDAGHQMHYWSRNITDNFTWHEYANARIISHVALSNLTEKSYSSFSQTLQA